MEIYPCIFLWNQLPVLSRAVESTFFATNGLVQYSDFLVESELSKIIQVNWNACTRY